MSDDHGSVFGARSIYGASTRRGLVEVTFSPEQQTVTPAKAREMAAYLVEAATAAEGDEVLMRVLDRAGLSRQRATQVLIAMRAERGIIEAAARREARRQIAEDELHEDSVE